MRQQASWRLYLGLVCLFTGAWMFEQAAFEQSKAPAKPLHPITATLLLIVGMALIRGWWRIKRRLARIIEEAVAKSHTAKLREAQRETAKNAAPPQSRPARSNHN